MKRCWIIFIMLILVVSVMFSLSIRTTGATFPQYQVQKWIREYEKVDPAVKIEYQGGGSGHGQEMFLKGLTDIGRTDPPVKESVWKKFLTTEDIPLQFPIVAGAVVVAYNVPNLEKLKLDGETLGKIFAGDIVYWDDESIKNLNPDVILPHEKMIIIHRSDSSGTTKIFTTYLSMVCSTFKNKIGAGKLVNWTVDAQGRGIGAKGNPGIVSALKNTGYSIAYTELAFAINENLNVVSIKNKDGEYVFPTTETIKSALAGVKTFVPNPKEGYKEDLKQFLNAPGKYSYPIVALTHFLVWKNVDGKHYTKEKAKAIKEFLKWVLTEGQKEKNLEIGYIGLPKEVAEIGLKAVYEIEE